MAPIELPTPGRTLSSPRPRSRSLLMHGLHGRHWAHHSRPQAPSPTFSLSLRHICLLGFLAHRRKQRSRELLVWLIAYFPSSSLSLIYLGSIPLPHLSGLTGDPLLQTPRGAPVGIMSKPQSTNGSESEFEFIETPKAPTPSFEKFEECGVRTTSVRLPLPSLPLPVPSGVMANTKQAYMPARRVYHL